MGDSTPFNVRNAKESLVRLVDLRRYDDLERIAKRILAQDPADVETLSLYALAIRNKGRLEEALEILETAISHDPEYSYAWYLRAFYLKLAYRDRDAFDAAIRAAELDSMSAMVQVELSICAYNVGEHKIAARSVERAISLEPNYEQAWRNKGDHAFWASRYEDAERSYREALRLAPDSALYLSNLGKVLVELGRADDAIGYYRRAVIADPRAPQGLVGLSRTLAATGQDDEAFSWAERALETFPDTSWVRSHWLDLLSRKDYERAVEEARKAAEEHPHRSNSWLTLASKLRDSDRTEEALEFAQQGSAMEPQARRGHHLVASLLYRLGRKDEAIARLRTYVDTTSNNAASWRLLASFLRTSDPDAAREALERALAADPSNVTSYQVASCTYVVMGDHEAAMSALAKMFELSPSADVYEHSAWIRFHLGRDDFPSSAAEAKKRLEDPGVIRIIEVMEKLWAKDWAGAKTLAEAALEDGDTGCEAAAFFAAASAHLDDIELAQGVLAGASVGRSRAKLCASLSCPNGGYLKRQIADASGRRG